VTSVPRRYEVFNQQIDNSVFITADNIINNPQFERIYIYGCDHSIWEKADTHQFSRADFWEHGRICFERDYLKSQLSLLIAVEGKRLYALK